jgi:lipopolysaccharide/colanic/teichoic acid biosynthesis glycosyltransferase
MTVGASSQTQVEHLVASQLAGAHRRFRRPGGVDALDADRGDRHRRAFAHLSADRASPLGPRRQSALGAEVPHHVADQRVCSRFARFCRRHSIDELPQLLHVVRGEMSLVGPRPITDTEWELHYRPHAAEVLDVKPGLSGLWQIGGRSRLTYAQRRELDLALARNRSLKLYFQILLWTLPEIWTGRNAW